MAVPVKINGASFEPGAPQALFTATVAAHGQKFLVNTIVGDSDNAPLEVTLNWTTGLKK